VEGRTAGWEREKARQEKGKKRRGKGRERKGRKGKGKEGKELWTSASLNFLGPALTKPVA